MRGAARKVGVDQLVAIRIVQMTLDTIIEVLATEGRLELRDFGVFEVRTRKARRPGGATTCSACPPFVERVWSRS